VKGIRSRLSYANVTATAALFLALAGGTTAIALSGKNSVKSDDIAHGAVKADDIAALNVKSGDIAKETVGGGKVTDGTISAADVGTGAVGASEILDGSVGTGDQAAVPAAHVIGSNLPIPPQVFTTLSLSNDSTGDAFDPLDMWTASDPTRIVAPVAGMYVVVADVHWANDATTVDQGWRLAQVSGGGQTSRQVVPAVRTAAGVSGETMRQTVSLIARLAAGDGITVSADQDNEDDSTINVLFVDLETSWVGPAP